MGIPWKEPNLTQMVVTGKDRRKGFASSTQMRWLFCMTPEKLHLALNHFVFLFPLAALIPLIVGLIRKNREALIAGLAIAFIGSLFTGAVMGTGEEAYERYEDGPIAAYLDPGAEAALEHHEEVGHTWSKVMYALLAVSLAALIIAWAKRAWLPYAGIATAVFCVASVAAGIYIADSGGKIRRPDFREPALPAEHSGASGEHGESHDHD